MSHLPGLNQGSSSARLRHIAGNRWRIKRYLQIDRLAEVVAIAYAEQPQPKTFLRTISN